MPKKPPSTKKTFFLISVLLFFIFSQFSLYVKRGRLTSFDFNTIVKIQDRVPTTYDFIFSNLTLLGSLEITTLILIGVLVFRRKLGGILVFFLFVFGNLADLFGKAYLEHPGPPIYFLREHAPPFLPQWYSHPVSSYPSGHALRIVFLFVVLGFLIWGFKKFNKNARIFGVVCTGIIAILVILSRVSLGKHWPSDVLGGGLLGGSLGFLSLLFL